jgi:2-C-methyl-D-erythritol 4-phosphate cytidylyltransferase / 2-C-methyl-D-erythritol 2,4-cyclodiphosphate synthase
MKIAAVIVAAGNGSRAGGELPKQYQKIGGEAILRRTLRIFANHSEITVVQTVIGANQHAAFDEVAMGLKVAPPVVGGATRQMSCRIGIEACSPLSPDIVLIHDAARPFVSHEAISSVIAALQYADGAIPALPVADTIKLGKGGIIERTLDRSSLYNVQTPQGFHFLAIRDAHARAAASGRTDYTDDAAVAEAAGLKVKLLPGDPHNRKLTTLQDIAMADAEIKQQSATTLEIRVGQGIDFHRFEPGTSLWLCGVEISHSHKLSGHSDADVALHALTDAILGAIGEGDIGTHFPPTDPQWKGARSSIFLAKARGLLEAMGGSIANVDITILTEVPKIAPHVAKMKTELSRQLAIDKSRIAIKATTTEMMGAIGRKEGMAAMAIATVRLPP